jgi:hypothetical protein
MSTNTSQTVSATLATGHQADPVHCYKFHILQQICITNYILNYYLGSGEDDKKPGLIPSNTIRKKTVTGDLTEHFKVE